MIQVLFALYQYLIAWPIAVLLTIFTAVFTIVLYPWRNAEFVHREQQFWSRSMCRLMFLPVSVDGLENIKPGQS